MPQWPQASGLQTTPEETPQTFELSARFREPASLAYRPPSGYQHFVRSNLRHRAANLPPGRLLSHDHVLNPTVRNPPHLRRRSAAKLTGSFRDLAKAA